MTERSRQSNIRFIWAICTFVLCVWIGSFAFAQSVDVPDGALNGNAVPAQDVDVQFLSDLLDVDYAAWTSVAERTEGLLLRGVASAFALDRLHIELSTWRDTFASEMEENEARVETVNSQIAALGTVPGENETEAVAITDRRAALILQHDDLAAPGFLAAEAHARASGMMGEIEVQLRARQRAALMVRGVSPLNPSHWPDAVTHFIDGLRTVANETTGSLIATRWSGENIGRVFGALIALIIAVGLFWRGQVWARAVVPQAVHGAGHVLSEFFITILQAVLPLIGLTALVYGLGRLDIFGVRGEAVLSEIPLTGSIIILAAWLGKQFFPIGDANGPLNIVPELRLPIRRTSNVLAWGAALWLPYVAFVVSGNENEAAIAVLNFPFILVLSVLLFRFSTLLRYPPDLQASANATTGRTRSVVGRIAQGVAIAAPLFAALGYDAAAKAILFPAILTLGLLGVIVYLQALSYRVYELLYGAEDGRNKALVPVAIGFVLLLLAVPVLALIWGAQSADLWAYWTRFTEGFALGDTRISPSDFLTFILIFSAGYLLTGFIKTTLRTSVLPRTNLDLGAQDAIVAGFGYVGIFLASVIAITSAGIDLSNLAIVAGALSVGIGFGLQTIVSNFVSGIILLIERPVSQGDWIEVGGQMGYVRSISVRSTRIETFDRTDVIVPNADLISNQVINWTRGNLSGRLILKIGVAYGTDVDRVAAILREIAEAHPMVVMTPPPAVLFMNFGADSLDFEVRAILRDINFVLSVQSEMNFEISRRFADEGIEIPFAQRDIWLRNPEVLGQSTESKDQKPVAVPKPTPRPVADDPETDNASEDPE